MWAFEKPRFQHRKTEKQVKIKEFDLEKSFDNGSEAVYFEKSFIILRKGCF